MHFLQKFLSVEMVVKDSSIFLGDNILLQLGESVFDGFGAVESELLLLAFFCVRFFERMGWLLLRVADVCWVRMSCGLSMRAR